MKKYAYFFNWILSRRYDIIVEGKDVLKGGGSRLYLPNHQAEVDPMILMTEIVKQHNVAPMISAQYYNLPIIKHYMKKLGAVAVADLDQGVRDVSVMDTIRDGAKSAFSEGSSILLYPAGQLASQGYEKIFNKQSAYSLVNDSDDNLKIIGVRIYGLWGSIWSRAWLGVSPSFFPVFLKSIFFFFSNLIFFLPKREVRIEFHDITNEAKEKAKSLRRREFNEYLEEFYNVNGEEKLRYIKHHFLQGKLNKKMPNKIKGIISSSTKEIEFTKLSD